MTFRRAWVGRHSSTRVGVAFALAMLAGCACCNAPPDQTFTFDIDDATARSICGGPCDDAYRQVPCETECVPCETECDMLVGRRASIVDTDRPDANVLPPSLSSVDCSLATLGSTNRLRCTYSKPCPD